MAAFWFTQHLPFLPQPDSSPSPFSSTNMTPLRKGGRWRGSVMAVGLPDRKAIRQRLPTSASRTRKSTRRASSAMRRGQSRASSGALEIITLAQRRLADEYDTAQERGEVRGSRERTASSPEAVGVTDLGLSHKDIHEARIIRDAERAEPGRYGRYARGTDHTIAGHAARSSSARRAICSPIDRRSRSRR